MKNPNRWIMGSAISLAAIVTAIDHTRHRLPSPDTSETESGYERARGSGCGLDEENPCGMNANPCGLNNNPCGLDENPCGLTANPCGLG